MSQNQRYDILLHFIPESLQPQEWYTLGSAPMRLQLAPITLPGENPIVESGTLSLYYRYEPDWTDVTLRLVIEAPDGSEIASRDWYGATHAKKTPHGQWYEFPVPREIVEKLVSGKGTQGLLVRREYVSGGRNSNHPLVFGAPGGSDAVRPVLKIGCTFSGVAAPTAPSWTMQPPPNPIKGHALLTWEHREPRDFNQGSTLSYIVQTSTDQTHWSPLPPIAGDQRQLLIPLPNGNEGQSLFARIRAVNNLGASSPWIQADAPYRLAKPDDPGFEAFLESPLRKIQRFERVEKPAVTPDFFAARNESEAIQVVVAGSETLPDLRVSLDPFTGPDGAVLPADRVCVYRQEYINVTKPSKNVGQIGWWPDALVPLRDRYFGELRGRRPMIKNGGENESFWIEIDVPPDQISGTYHSAVRIEGGSRTLTVLPLDFTVRKYALPAHSTLKTSFGCDPSTLGASYPQYFQEAVRHRIALNGGFFTFMGSYDAKTDTCRINPSQAERFFENAMSGRNMPDNRSFNSINVTGKPDVNTDQAWSAYWRSLEAYLASRNWLDRSFVYAWDEPRDRDITNVVNKCRQIKAGASTLKTLVTTECRPELRGLVDIWCPVINYFDRADKNGGEALYRSRQKEGEDVWWYTSCMSSESKSLPSYFIDASAVSPRVVGWLSWRKGVQGVLYYHMAYSWKNLPWENQFAFDANGDGTLWYPGTPEYIGGTKATPVSSIRLKAIRDGFEDYEYLALLEKLGGKAEAERICGEVGSGPYTWRDDPAIMIKARAQLAEAIERLGGN